MTEGEAGTAVPAGYGNAAVALWHRLSVWSAPLARGLLYITVALLPIHAGLVSIGIPSWWKELFIWLTFLIALTLPARARLERVDLLVAVYFAMFVLSAATHHVTSFAELSPYFAYVPLAIILPRLLLTSRDVSLLVYVALGSLLFNAMWMAGTRAGLIDFPNLLTLDGPTWKTTGSLTGGELATATLYGVTSGTAWISAAMSRRPVLNVLLALALTAAAASTGSRGALLASMFGLFIAVAVTAARLRSRRRIGPLLIGLCVCLAVAAILAGPYAVRSDDPLRISRWEATLQLAAQHPLLGAGPGATSQARILKQLGLTAESIPPDNLIGNRMSESSVLKVAAELGLPALLLMTAWLLSILIRRGILQPLAFYGRPYDYAGPALVVLTVVNGLTYPNMESFVGATLFWVGIGLCRARWTTAEQRPSHLPDIVRSSPTS